MERKQIRGERKRKEEQAAPLIPEEERKGCLLWSGANF
jgi:hypothetical protein